MNHHTGSTDGRNSWIVNYQPKPMAGLRIFCVPYAGVGVSAFHSWSKVFGPDVEVCAFQLPGRENRLREAPIKDIYQLVEIMASQMSGWLDKSFVLFGHSMGALVAFELARALRRANLAQPQQLLVSGHRAPQLPDPFPPIHTLSNPDFVVEIRRRYKGIPDEVLRDAELLALFLPILRADLELIESYRYCVEEPLDLAISVYGGKSDSRVSEQELSDWRLQTKRSFRLHMFQGGHWFIRDSLELLCQTMLDDLVYAGTMDQAKAI